MSKSFNTTTNETFTTSDNRTVRFEDIFEGIDTSIQCYGAGRGKYLPKQDLEDMFQDAALKVIANQASFDLDKCHGLPQAFGYRVATFQEFDAFRKAEKRRKTFTPFERTNEDGDEYDAMDPVFSPSFTFMSDSYRDEALKQIGSMGGATGIDNVASYLADSYALIEDVVDYKDSEAYKSGSIKDLDTKDTAITLELNKEPAVSGSLKTACQLADALVLQYYECPDAKAAAFGHDLSDDQWKLVSQSKDAYVDILYTAPLVATNIAHPLLQEIGNEMDAQGRLFTFLCGHDSNIASVLAALKVEEYELPGAIEVKTPIGSKLVFERWANANGEQFGRVRLLYQSVDQLRLGTMLAGSESPQSVDLSFDGLKKNEDGLYSYDELRAHVKAATDEYDNIVQKYGEAELAQAA